ncbi:carboxylesterase/lipase domain protein [Metarhizium robertsii]|uniref:Carboxylic ester hydrolase n=2 Tax=Metarhizium robertsii TaxID=568076 RepID=E9EK06_METRA|nr:Carboxylesterase type B [Metarhizium robertsii ARSEF 23]EFZ03017.1 Carboxylesterase type B [Metarhizium robertsii ARSEF 23]EXU98883.1 carboxylesterase/lipase domain protein [Metarhizium robertsii]
MGNTLSYTTQQHTVDLGPRGSITGLQYDNKARRYAAVPYALPPTGQHRWRKPRPLPPSFTYSPANQPFNATELRPPAAQEDRDLATGQVNSANDGVKGTEDCLYVNIWTPVPADAAATAKWPVMVWLHGGWFQVGDACHDAASDPTELISTGGLNAIVVAVSYRLNVFGFLSSGALLEESGGEAAGNFGLWDQRLALEWVHDNIAAFGGDVDNMTIAGRSAGAYGVEAQILHDFRRHRNPRAGKLFRRAWMSSNAIPAQPKTVQDAEAQFDEVCEHFGMPASLPPAQRLARLRATSEADLVKCIRHLKSHTFRPVTDGLFFHAGMVEYLQSEAFAEAFASRGMKLLIGEVANEETLYAQFNGPTEPTLESLRLQAANYYSPAATAKILGQYSLPKSRDIRDWKDAFGRIIADGQVRASSRYLVDALSRHGLTTRDIWRYRIDYRLSFIDETVAPMEYGVSHAMDGPLWNYSINQLPTDEERKMLDTWVKILVAFVGGDEDFDFGTRTIDEVKVLTSKMDVAIEKDARYNELRELGAIFSQN